MWRHGGEKKKERDGVSLAFGIRAPSRRLARRAISSVVECAPNRCAWTVRVLSHMDSSMCLSAPDHEMWIIQGTIAWHTPHVQIGIWITLPPSISNSKFDNQLEFVTFGGKPESPSSLGDSPKGPLDRPFCASNPKIH
ncbi:hypothetical protein H5410_030281 [Solanum commersonii]|uniref:Uncharacterized protein n=1 Tax=Solanum commersonii TaxID=4109 RepID=A0A9J5YGE4_SOLCO|nr:hypothetical protein H5410_030281 [Solanum commersonii]